MISRRSVALFAAGLAAVFAGALVAMDGAALPAAVVAPGTVYTAATACSACPTGVSLDSVEVQQRDGSTLFVVRGTLPASADSLHSDVRLQAGDLTVVLKPHGSAGAFEIVSATRAGSPTATASVTAGIQQGALLIDVAPPLHTPVTFSVGFWNGSAYQGSLPRTGTLTWRGGGAPS